MLRGALPRCTPTCARLAACGAALVLALGSIGVAAPCGERTPLFRMTADGQSVRTEFPAGDPGVRHPFWFCYDGKCVAMIPGEDRILGPIEGWHRVEQRWALRDGRVSVLFDGKSDYDGDARVAPVFVSEILEGAQGADRSALQQERSAEVARWAGPENGVPASPVWAANPDGSLGTIQTGQEPRLLVVDPRSSRIAFSRALGRLSQPRWVLASDGDAAVIALHDAPDSDTAPRDVVYIVRSEMGVDSLGTDGFVAAFAVSRDGTAAVLAVTDSPSTRWPVTGLLALRWAGGPLSVERTAIPPARASIWGNDTRVVLWRDAEILLVTPGRDGLAMESLAYPVSMEGEPFPMGVSERGRFAILQYRDCSKGCPKELHGLGQGVLCEVSNVRVWFDPDEDAGLLLVHDSPGTRGVVAAGLTAYALEP